MPTEAQREQAERREVLENKKRLRLQREREGSTFFAHTHPEDEGGGRFAAINNATIIGGTPIPKYPELPSTSPWSGTDPVPDEEPFGVAVDWMPPLESSSGEATDPASVDAPSAVAPSVDVPRADAGSSFSTTKGPTDDAA
jgi:hypothetical protein